jgi:hypothetical protein
MVSFKSPIQRQPLSLSQFKGFLFGSEALPYLLDEDNALRNAELLDRL